MPAPSLTLLDDRLSEVSCLVSICHSRRARRARHIRAEEPALLRGALVLLCSHIEGFFEELVEDIIEAFDHGVRTPAGMPDAIRQRQILGDGKRWEGIDQMHRWQLVRACAASPLFEDARQHISGQLDPGLHTEGFANPGTGAIKELFKSVGLPDCWATFGQIEPRRTYKNEIDAIVARRNQIAHGDMNSSVTEQDILGYAANFRHTATVFERVARDHVTAFVPGFAW